MDVVTLRLPAVGAQLMEKSVRVVLPAVTETVRVLPPLTVQLDATPLNATEWLPAESPLKVTLPFAPMDLLELPSTETV